MTRAEFYRTMAKQAAREAESAPEHLKPELLLIAERWRSLAELIAAHEQVEPPERQPSYGDDHKPGE